MHIQTYLGNENKLLVIKKQYSIRVSQKSNKETILPLQGELELITKTKVFGNAF